MDIVGFLDNITHNGALVTFIISMIPVIELRGAIPIGISLGLSKTSALCIAIIGNMLPVPFIIVFIREIFAFMRKRMPFLENFVSKMEHKVETKRDFIYKWQLLGLALVVAVPLPGTGAWTGALIAALMDIRLSRAVPSIFLGIVVAGLLVTGITFGFGSIFA
ncbi:MAG: COG2426 family protein [Oscillospiraceae bacterium]